MDEPTVGVVPAVSAADEGVGFESESGPAWAATALRSCTLMSLAGAETRTGSLLRLAILLGTFEELSFAAVQESAAEVVDVMVLQAVKEVMI